jgi:hypothetical protein
MAIPALAPPERPPFDAAGLCESEFAGPVGLLVVGLPTAPDEEDAAAPVDCCAAKNAASEAWKRIWTEYALRPGGANPATEDQLLYVAVIVVVDNCWFNPVRYAGNVTTEVPVVGKLLVHGTSKSASIPLHVNEL